MHQFCTINCARFSSRFFVTAFCAPVWFVELLGWSFVCSAALVGALIGATLGKLMPSILAGPLKKVPLSLLVLAGPALGFVWGGLTGLLAVPTLYDTIFHDLATAALLSIVVAGIAGAIQFGWFWLPYTLSRIKGRGRTWVVGAACLGGPVLGPLGVFLTI